MKLKWYILYPPNWTKFWVSEGCKKMDIFVRGGNVIWWALFGRQFSSYYQNENFWFPLTRQVEVYIEQQCHYKNRNVKKLNFYKEKNSRWIWGTFTQREGFPRGSVVENPLASAEDACSIPGPKRSSGEGDENPVQCSCLEVPTDGGV